MRDPQTRPERRARPLGRAFRDAARPLRTAAWFPQVPIAAAVAFAGGHLLWATFGSTWGALTTGALATDLIPPSDLPYLLIGASLITVSVGLAFRSRVSWAIALVLTLSVVLFVARFGHPSGRYLWGLDGLLVVVLVLTRRRFDRAILGGSALMAVLVVVPALTYAAVGSFYLGHQFSPPITSLFTGIYYAIVTMTTVGYGDIVPRTDAARLFAMQLIILGVGLFATVISAVIGPLVRGSLARLTGQREGRMDRSNHFVIVGSTPIAENTYREMKRRDQPVTVIVKEIPGGRFDTDDVVIGDANDVEVLRRANVDRARAVMVMRPDDFESAFVVLAVKELKGSAKTYLILNDRKHLERVKLVHPNVIMTPDVLGGELLAMALTGQDITGQYVLGRLFEYEEPTGTGS